MTAISPDILQWIGCAFGVTGSLLLATKTRYSGWGFVLFLISNGFWAAYGIVTNAQGLLAMQIFFSATSTLGIYRWLISQPKCAPVSRAENRLTIKLRGATDD